MALRDKIRKTREFNVIVEESPIKESKSNGMIENTIRVEQGQIRTLRDGIESRYKKKIDR